MDECKPLARGVPQGRALLPHRGRAVQVDPSKPTLKAPGAHRLKVRYVEPLSDFAFKFKLCRYIVGVLMTILLVGASVANCAEAGTYTRPLLTST